MSEFCEGFQTVVVQDMHQLDTEQIPVIMKEEELLIGNHVVCAQTYEPDQQHVPAPRNVMIKLGEPQMRSSQPTAYIVPIEGSAYPPIPQGCTPHTQDAPTIYGLPTTDGDGYDFNKSQNLQKYFVLPVKDTTAGLHALGESKASVSSGALLVKVPNTEEGARLVRLNNAYGGGELRSSSVTQSVHGQHEHVIFEGDARNGLGVLQDDRILGGLDGSYCLEMKAGEDFHQHREGFLDSGDSLQYPVKLVPSQSGGHSDTTILGSSQTCQILEVAKSRVVCIPADLNQPCRSAEYGNLFKDVPCSRSLSPEQEKMQRWHDHELHPCHLLSDSSDVIVVTPELLGASSGAPLPSRCVASQGTPLEKLAITSSIASFPSSSLNSGTVFEGKVVPEGTNSLSSEPGTSILGNGKNAPKKIHLGRVLTTPM